MFLFISFHIESLYNVKFVSFLRTQTVCFRDHNYFMRRSDTSISKIFRVQSSESQKYAKRGKILTGLSDVGDTGADNRRNLENHHIAEPLKRIYNIVY
jgi:hypothetical protein